MDRERQLHAGSGFRALPRQHPGKVDQYVERGFTFAHVRRGGTHLVEISEVRKCDVDVVVSRFRGKLVTDGSSATLVSNE